MVTAVLAERDVLAEQFTAFADRLGPFESATAGPYPVLCGRHVALLAGGVGPAAAASATASVLAAASATASGLAGSGQFDLVLSAGIGGGFTGRAGVGDLVAASEIRAADLGAVGADGFLSVDDLGFGSSLVPAVDLGVPGAHVGPVLTVSTVTGTEQRARELMDRFDAAAEAMEGFGVAEAARAYGLPVGELRGISNLVGRRDRSTWDIPAGLDALRRSVPRLVDLIEEGIPT
ncbi:MAG TPA: futalosine hydrolase [Frankiaceae bacterium]|nr:futalosine hydrolase [Frankiaceae bacterium]